MADDTVTQTDERCDNCGTRLVRIEPEGETPGPASVGFMCPPTRGGCGLVDRYEDSDGNQVTFDAAP